MRCKILIRIMPKVFKSISYADKFLAQLWIQCKNEEFCDVVLAAGDAVQIPAHRSVLSIASDYFKEIFATQLDAKKEIKLLCDGIVLQNLIEFCYTGSIEIKEDHIVETLGAAQVLHLNFVVESCENFVVEQLDPSNCLEILRFSKQNHFKALLEKALHFTLDNFMYIYHTEEFLALTEELMRLLLANDMLCVATEEDVFHSLMKWIRHDPVDREKYKYNLLKLVRMPLLDKSFIMKDIKPVCTKECLELYLQAVEWHLQPDIKKINKRKPRTPYQLLMGITLKDKSNMCIHYYCYQRSKWMKWSKVLSYRSNFGMAIMKTKLYYIGGIGAEDEILNTGMCFNLETMKLNQMKAMSEKRGFCCVAVLNDCIYVVGGIDGTNYLRTVEKWDSKTNKWSYVAPMIQSRCSFGMVECNGKLYVFGGSSGNSLRTAECYNANEDKWKSIASMHERRKDPQVAAANGYIYAVGRWLGDKTVERYDCETNMWTMICSLDEKMVIYHSCATFRDKVIVCFDDRVVEYDSVTNKWIARKNFNGLPSNHRIFTYTDKILTTGFVES